MNTFSYENWCHQVTEKFPGLKLLFGPSPVLLQILLFTFCNSLHKIHKFCQLTELLGPTGGSALPQREDLSVCVEAAQSA